MRCFSCLRDCETGSTSFQNLCEHRYKYGTDLNSGNSHCQLSVDGYCANTGWPSFKWMCPASLSPGMYMPPRPPPSPPVSTLNATFVMAMQVYNSTTFDSRFVSSFLVVPLASLLALPEWAVTLGSVEDVSAGGGASRRRYLLAVNTYTVNVSAEMQFWLLGPPSQAESVVSALNAPTTSSSIVDALNRRLLDHSVIILSMSIYLLLSPPPPPPMPNSPRYYGAYPGPTTSKNNDAGSSGKSLPAGAIGGIVFGVTACIAMTRVCFRLSNGSRSTDNNDHTTRRRPQSVPPSPRISQRHYELPARSRSASVGGRSRAVELTSYVPRHDELTGRINYAHRLPESFDDDRRPRGNQAATRPPARTQPQQLQIAPATTRREAFMRYHRSIDVRDILPRREPVGRASQVPPIQAHYNHYTPNRDQQLWQHYEEQSTQRQRPASTRERPVSLGWQNEIHTSVRSAPLPGFLEYRYHDFYGSGTTPHASADTRQARGYR